MLLTTKFLIASAVTTTDIPSYAPPREKTISEIIDEKALQYNVSAEQLYFTLNCESSMNPKALNPHGEFSVGLSQINLQAHTSITREQAEQPLFAIDFMAKNLAQGKWKMWYNCSNQYFANKG